MGAFRTSLLLVVFALGVGGAYLVIRSSGDPSRPVAKAQPTLSGMAKQPATQIGLPAGQARPSTMPVLRTCLKTQGFSAHRLDSTHVRARSGDFGPIVIRLFPTVAEARAHATPAMTAPITDPANPPTWILANNALIHGMVFVGFRNERLAFGVCLTRVG